LYLIDVRQVLFVLNHEPRFLSITPDTGLIDLHMTHDTDIDLPSTYRSEYEPVNLLIQMYIEQLRQNDKDIIIDDRYAAVPLVTAVYFNSQSHVPSPPIHTLSDGTDITNFPKSLAKWAMVNDTDRTALYDAGCVDSTGSGSSATCTQDVRQQAMDAEQRFWTGIRQAIRQAEQIRSEPNYSTSTSGVGLPNFQCRKRTRFGAGPHTVRVNAQLTLSQIMDLLVSANLTIDFKTSRVVPKQVATTDASSSAIDAGRPTIQTEL
jgi:hypothetical protein